MIDKNLKLYIQLLEVFSIREIKSRYKASILGFLWIVLYPLTTAVILNIIFSIIIRIPTGNIPYFLFLLSGLLYWNFFQQGFILAKDALIWNRDLIIKTAFPKSTLPLSYVFSRIPDFIVNIVILLLFYLYYGYIPNITFLLIIIFIIPILLFSSGVAMIASSLNAIFRDFGRIVELFMMLAFYATPIVYPDSLLPERFKILLLLNPVSNSIIFTRDLLFKKVIRFDLFFLAIIISLPVFILGMLFFIKLEKKIADLI